MLIENVTADKNANYSNFNEQQQMNAKWHDACVKYEMTFPK